MNISLNLIIRISCVTVGTLVILFLWNSTPIITGLLLALAIIDNLKSSKQEIIFYFVGGILGTLFESLAISSGAWVHSVQHIYNFPIWLPLYWGMGSLAMKEVYFIIHKPIQK